MPSMPRINKKCSDIAYAILGRPLAQSYKKTKREKDIDAKINKVQQSYINMRHV